LFWFILIFFNINHNDFEVKINTIQQIYVINRIKQAFYRLFK
jgi:hypothetical protein